MNWQPVTFVRVYLTEGDKQLKSMLACLHDEEKVLGVSVFRAISGFGRSGVVHSGSLLDLSLNLPVTVEFFDVPERIEIILKHFEGRFDSGHIVRWQAEMNI